MQQLQKDDYFKAIRTIALAEDILIRRINNWLVSLGKKSLDLHLGYDIVPDTAKRLGFFLFGFDYFGKRVEYVIPIEILLLSEQEFADLCEKERVATQEAKAHQEKIDRENRRISIEAQIKKLQTELAQCLSN